MQTMPINNIQKTEFKTNLFIPIVNAIANHIHHDRTLWGIRFPVIPPSFHQSAINVVEEHLEGRRHPVLKTTLQRLDLTIIVLAVIVEVDWKSVKHKLRFWKGPPLFTATGPVKY
jgi:hypothetical protein